MTDQTNLNPNYSLPDHPNLDLSQFPPHPPDVLNAMSASGNPDHNPGDPPPSLLEEVRFIKRNNYKFTALFEINEDP